MSWRIVRIGAIAAVPLLLILLFLPRFGRHRIILKAYFTNAMGLRQGAPVRLAGVDIGSVKSVRAMPERKQAPVEVVMVITPFYDLRIPVDSTATLETAGLLGETFVDINSAAASGPPVGDGGTLRTTQVAQVSAHEIVQKIADAISKRSGCEPKNSCDGAPKTSAPTSQSH